MDRRQFIRQLATVSAGTMAFASLDPLRPRLRIAEAAGGKTLIVIFQRGGCDGVNTVIPYGDAAYAGLRPTIRVPAPNAADPRAALDLDGYFGLHPGLAGLLPIWQAGDLAVLPACHYPDASQSHFDGQQFIESGAPLSTLDGWLNRHLVSLPRPAALRAAGFGSELPHALRGQQTVSSFNDIAEFSTELPTDTETALLSDLTRVYNQTPDSARAYRDLVYGSGRVMVNDLSVLSVIDVGSYVPANGAVYPATTLGRQLRQVAQLIKQDLGLEVAALGIGGWDTHADQGNGDPAAQQARRHQDFGGSIGAFYADLGPLMADVVVLTMTEFGRTARENGSRGTDHGHAAAWFVAGGSVTGGVYGTWPGLGASQLLYGRYLDHSVDFRDVMGEVLTRHLGSTDLATILPGHTFAPVGFLPA
jgi:uncharacterized protein (DUF1501 family)